MKKQNSIVNKTVCRILQRQAGRSVMLIVLAAFTAITWAALRTAALRIVIIGDSTAYTYAASDSLRGWGQELRFFFTTDAVTVINKALGGRSSRSFIEDGHWASTKAILQKGDILLISFGTNDRGTVPERHADTAQFRQYLSQYVNEARALGVVPVLLSTVNQNSWNGTTFTEGFNIGANDYHGAMLRVVHALDVPFIDLEQKSAALFKSLGQSYLANFIFIAGNTHFREMGAVTIAKLVAEGIRELSDDPAVGTMSALLAPLYMVNVTSDKAGAGMITASGTYPPGAPISLEVLPALGQTFRQWTGSDEKPLTTNKRYTFAMGSAECSFTARFLGGTTIAQAHPVVPAVNHCCPIRITTASSSKLFSITSENLLRSVRVFDVSGRTVKTIVPESHRVVIDLRSCTTGVYFFTMVTSDGIVHHTVHFGE